MKFIAPIVFIIAAAGLAYWYIVPQYEQIQSLQTELSQYSEASTRATAAIQKQGALEAQYATISAADLSNLQAFLPSTNDDIGAANDVADVAALYKANLQNVTVTDNSAKPGSNGSNGTPAPAAPYGTITMTFTVALPYPTFIQFLQSLENSLHFTDVTSIQFSAAAAQPYSYAVTISKYWLN